MRAYLPILLIIRTFVCTKGDKILGISPFPVHSHHTLVFRLMEELAHRGHEVTFINCFPLETPIKNFENIVVGELRSPINQISSNMPSFAEMSYIGQMDYVTEMGKMIFNTLVDNEEVNDLLKSNRKFDAVILNFCFTHSLAYFAHRFDSSLIILAPWPMNVFYNHLVANPSPSSYVTHLLTDYGAEMTFWQRLHNTYREVLGELYVNFRMIPEHDKVVKRRFADAPDLSTILYNSSLMLSPSHVCFSQAVPLQQNVKEIGGYHIKPPKLLPKELQVFMDNSTEGVVLFSMGSNLRSTIFEPGKVGVLLNAFSKLKQKVLWKCDQDFPGVPRNVKILSWIPQSDVLRHPNTVAFISHGGLLSTTEAAYFGVPVLGMPVHWDQVKNVAGIVQKGYGIRLDFKDLEESAFEEALGRILSEPKYRRIAEDHSKIMHDEPMKAMDKAMFWIEYVIRHKGAPHLRSAALNLKWYQLYIVDIILFILSIFSISVMCLYKIWVHFRKCMRKPEKKSVGDKKIK